MVYLHFTILPIDLDVRKTGDDGHDDGSPGSHGRNGGHGGGGGRQIYDLKV